jgi:hypothetical protein
MPPPIHVDTVTPHADVKGKHTDVKSHTDSTAHSDVPKVHTDRPIHVDVPLHTDIKNPGGGHTDIKPQ